MVIDAINRGARAVPAWTLYPLGALPVLWLFYQGAIGGLGVDPVKAIEHQLGLWALWLLIAGLTVSPLMRFAGVRLLKFRRAIGLLSFAYVTVHLLVWLVLDVQILSQIWADILKRPYITIGMAGFLLLVPLAVTSNDWSIRRFGAAAWGRLHRLVYPAVVLGALHYLMLVKGWQLEPILYAAAIAGLLCLRFVPSRKRRTRLASAA